jgi:acyl-coenzyme A synthetase/AMP-(fatty) acid ligase
VINVGGLKVHPEEVEAVINAQPGVRMSRVKARKSPITGAVVVAEVLPTDPQTAGPTLKAAILDACRTGLAAHKAPVALAFVDSLPISAGGKLERRHA